MVQELMLVLQIYQKQQIYPKIIVVDAGHGGRDSGTYSKDYSYWEKDINLNVLIGVNVGVIDISKIVGVIVEDACIGVELKKLLDAQEEIKVYYTRTEDRRLTLNQRVNLANDYMPSLLMQLAFLQLR